jgi:polysaccharide biosynthesis protein PslJ
MSQALPSTPARAELAAVVVVVGALGLVAASVTVNAGVKVAAPLAAVITAAVLLRRSLLAWHNLVAALLLVILLIPMRRYALPGSLPFQLDVYRLLVAVVFVGWCASLLVDPSTRLRKTGLGFPIVLVIFATLASVIANGDRVAEAGSVVSKNLTFFLSYFVVLQIVVSVTVTRRQVDALVRVLVAGGALIGGSAVVESRTHYNVFDHLHTILPFLRFQTFDGVSDPSRGYRTFASAQHPIALSAALVLIAPISIYLIRSTKQKRWWVAAVLLMAGTVSTVSRTSVLMLLATGIVLVLMRRGDMKRMWPALIPALVAVHFVLPGTLGTLKQSFFPHGGLVTQQSGAVGTSGQGRLADIGPALDSLQPNPLFGAGYATRRVGAPGFDGQILDDQWLGALIETGVLGVTAWLWLILRSVRRLVRQARRDESDTGWLLTALTASIVSFAVGMFFFDAFAFTQCTVIFFFVIALATVLTQHRDAVAPVAA